MDPAPAVTYATFEPVVTAITGLITNANIITILAGAAGVAIGFVFMWWGVRKVSKIIMGAFRKGRLSV